MFGNKVAVSGWFSRIIQKKEVVGEKRGQNEKETEIEIEFDSIIIINNIITPHPMQI